MLPDRGGKSQETSLTPRLSRERAQRASERPQRAPSLRPRGRAPTSTGLSLDFLLLRHFFHVEQTIPGLDGVSLRGLDAVQLVGGVDTEYWVWHRPRRPG